MKRFYDGEPCGTTRINLNRGPDVGRYALVRPQIYYHDGKVAWIHHIQDGDVPLYRINVLSLLGGYIFSKERRILGKGPFICLTACMVVAAAHGEYVFGLSSA